MRKVVDQNEKFEVAKITNMKGELVEYQVCDKAKAPGHTGFVVDRARQLAKARTVAGITHKGAGQTTLPKSAYPEQQTGFKRQPKGKKGKF